jgi:Spy/CpxP family protein refolding chaperone
MKHIITILLTLTLAFNVAAQNNDKKKDREKIEALKVAHITEELNLTQSEAQKFWPVYNDFEEKRQSLRKTKMNFINSVKTETMSEADAKSLVTKMMNLEKEESLLKTNYLSNLQNIISNKKIIKLFESERSFKVKMIKEFKGRHKK